MKKFLWLLILLCRSGSADTTSCQTLLPTLMQELDQQASHAIVRLTAPHNQILASIQPRRGFLPPQAVLLRNGKDYQQFPQLMAKELREVHSEIASLGGKVYRSEESSAMFSVLETGIPILLLPSATDAALLDHERDHFHLWRDLRAALSEHLPVLDATLFAYDAMNTPEGSLIAESRAIAVELRRLQSGNLTPRTLSGLAGMVNYPHFTALHEGLTLLPTLRKLAPEFPELLAIRLALQTSLSGYADAVHHRTRRLTKDRKPQFPTDYLSSVELQWFQLLDTWPQINRQMGMK